MISSKLLNFTKGAYVSMYKWNHGIYIQNKLCKLMDKKDFELYRDDGLGILRNSSGPEADRKHKSVVKIFK